MSTALEIDVSMENTAWRDALPGAPAIAQKAASVAFRLACEDGGPAPAQAEASLVLADDTLVRRLNREYRGQDKATNVLSFAGMDGNGGPKNGDASRPVLLGDLIVAFETTVAESAQSGKTLADHFCHLIVHGMLHLLGYDHQTGAQAERMEGLEVRILAELGIGDPYAADPEGLN